MNERDSIYREILRAGFESLRGAIEEGNLERCKAETDHLHNIPSLLGHEDETAHLHYLAMERAEYIKWISNAGRKDLLLFVKHQYWDRWSKLEKIAKWSEHLADPNWPK